MLLIGRLNSPLKWRKGKQACGMTILGNGPSLKDDFEKAISRPNQDIVGLNYFGCTDYFMRSKPCWYFLMDGAFFKNVKENSRRDDMLFMYKRFEEEVDWKMTIVVPAHYEKKFFAFSKITNSNIKVMGVNAWSDMASWTLRKYLYRHNYSLPAPQNVTILAIYAGINLGYKEIYLYGVDHTFIQGICVDEENRVCLKWDHFYDKDAKVKVLTDTLGGHSTLSQRLRVVAITFRSHELLRQYADLMGCQIINCTYGSMIDSYVRLSQIDKK